MTIQGSSDCGLGLWATCDCEDFAYRHHEMLIDEIDDRWRRSKEQLRVDSVTPISNSFYEIAVSGGDRPHLVLVSIGKNQAGPHWYCKHALLALSVVMERPLKMFAIEFRPPDGIQDDLFGQTDTVSIDGWLRAIVVRMEP